ncbi:MAG: amidohydrolase family protein [Acidobacteriota bacterium]
MILAGARWAVNESSTRRIDAEIAGGTIRACQDPRGRGSLDLSGLLLLPGLINAHDHLEFNLLPQLGRRIYSNATEWAADVHRPLESPVKEHLAIPLPVRLMWGGIRNLLSGVTTVSHHNPWQPSVFDSRFPVRVVKDFAWAHSLAFSPDLRERFLNTPSGWPFIVHAAEGTDGEAGSDIARLEELGVLAPHTVLVHAIAAGWKDWKTLRGHGTSLVWCPRSNLSTYGRTLSADALHSGLRIALGTDSAITSHGDLIDEIRTAIEACDMSAESVYRMVTSDAAAVLRLHRGEGFLNEGGVADIVAMADHGQTPAEALLNLKPEFVMVGGEFRLLSEDLVRGSLARASMGSFAEGFQPIEVASRGRCLIDADVDYLYGEAARVVGPKLRLSGRCVSVGAVA